MAADERAQGLLIEARLSARIEELERGNRVAIAGIRIEERRADIAETRVAELEARNLELQSARDAYVRSAADNARVADALRARIDAALRILASNKMYTENDLHRALVRDAT